MMDVHTIADSDLAALARGLGGPGAIQTLWSGQHSKRLLLLRLLIDRWPPATPGRNEPLSAIIDAEAGEPAEVRQVLTDPLVGAWAAGTARRLRLCTVEPADLAHFGAVAAVTALRAGTEARLPGYARGGWLYLPAMGRMRAPAEEGPVELSTRDGRLRIDGVDTGPSFEARRMLAAEGQPPLVVALEDLDPYRDAYHVPAAGRLTSQEADDWRRMLAEAWQILTRTAPERAVELADGMQCLVPLTKPDAWAARSATSAEAVGVVGLDRPVTATDFAIALVHEFQHSKLSAILDIVQLYERSDRTFFAPWRADPRPIGGLFHGVYAFLGVADMWRSLIADPVESDRATMEFARARVQVTDAVTTLAASNLLTDAGTRFVQGMVKSIDEFHTVSLPSGVVALVDRELENRRTTWNRREQAGRPVTH
jgi:uncharacterized protein